MTYEQWEEEKDRELDERLTTMFRGAVPPQPRAGFATRTLKAIRREPLAPGRRPLSQPWIVRIGWAALFAGTTAMAYFIVMNLPLLAGLFTRMLSGAIGIGVALIHFIGTGLALSNLFTTAGLAVARVVATREGSMGLIAMAVIAALSLSALHRLLFAEGGTRQWQRVS